MMSVRTFKRSLHAAKTGEGYSARVTPTMEEVLMEYLICNADGVRRQLMKHRPPMLAVERITAGQRAAHRATKHNTLVAAPIAVGVYIATIIWNGVSTRRLVARTTSGSGDSPNNEFDNKTMLLAWVFPSRLWRKI
jgi:hypothetical protein